MRIVALVPAKGSSKEIPRKNLHLLNGKPLLWYCLTKLKKLSILDIYVSSEDKEIRDYAESFGVNVIEEPERIPLYSTKLEECMEYFLEQVETDILVLVQPTSPLFRVEDLGKAIQLFISNLDGLDSLFSVVNTNDILFWNWKERNAINYNPLDRGIRQKRISDYYVETGAFYITTTKQFKTSRCRIGGRVGFFEVPFWTYPQVDSMEDLKMIEKLLKEEN